MENGALNKIKTVGNNSKGTESVSYLVEDILIPSILIGVLLVVNSIIVAVIIIKRRRQKGNLVLEEENFEDPKSEPLVADAKDM